MFTNKKHLKNTFYYTAAPFIRNLLLFLTLPILTRYLSPADYGKVNLITMLASFASMFFMGVQNSTVRFFFKYKSDNDLLKSMLSTNIIFVIISTAVYYLILLFCYPYINKYILNDGISFVWLSLGFFQFALMYVNTINQYFLQNSLEGKKWFYNEIVATVVQVFLSIFFVTTMGFRFEALILSGFLAELVKFFLSYLRVMSFYSFKLSSTFLKESLKYSWPQTPTNLVSFSYSYLDKILLSKFQNMSQVGFADLSSKISNILKMTTDGIAGTLSPVTLNLLHDGSKESLKKLSDINLKVIFLLFGAGLFLILFTKELILLLTTQEYHYLMYIAPIYMYYHIFGVLGMVSYWLIYYHTNKTFLQIPLNVINLVVSTAINIILIPRYGIWGAAIAIAGSSAVTQLVQFIVALRITPIPLDIVKIGLLFTLVVVETGVLYVLYWLNINIVLDIMIKIGMFSFFIFFGALIKVYIFEDVKILFYMIVDKLKGKKVTI